MPMFGIARKYAKDLPEYILTLSKYKVDAYEMGFAFGIPQTISSDIISRSREFKVALSCHLPFWINLGNSSREKNLGYIVSGLKIAEILDSVAVFHLGFYGGKRFGDLSNEIVSTIREALNLSDVKKGKLGIENTGKQQAIGTVEEIIELVNVIEDDRVIPVIDWSHLYARNNGISPYSYGDFRAVLEKLERANGRKLFYFHGGGIEYRKGNEVRHLSAKVHQPPIPHLFAALKDLGYRDFTFIFETPESIDDVEWLKRVWESPKDHFADVPRREATTLLRF